MPQTAYWSENTHGCARSSAFFGAAPGRPDQGGRTGAFPAVEGAEPSAHRELRAGVGTGSTRPSILEHGVRDGRRGQSHFALRDPGGLWIRPPRAAVGLGARARDS